MKFQQKDRIGERYGRLTVIAEGERNRSGRRLWVCECDCGNKLSVLGINLGRHTNSCGCIQSELAARRLRKHGLYGHPLYQIWISIKQRCYDHNSLATKKHYFDRGIRMCAEWESNFLQFYNDLIGSYVEGYSIERDDVDGDYRPGNVRWIPLPEQAKNKRTTRWIIIDGVKKCAADWARQYKIRPATLYLRLKRGFSDREAVFGRPHGNSGRRRQKKNVPII